MVNEIKKKLYLRTSLKNIMCLLLVSLIIEPVMVIAIVIYARRI